MWLKYIYYEIISNILREKGFTVKKVTNSFKNSFPLCVYTAGNWKKRNKFENKFYITRSKFSTFEDVFLAYTYNLNCFLTKCAVKLKYNGRHLKNLIILLITWYKGEYKGNI